MTAARIAIAVCGILLPYLARVPGGMTWLSQYTDTGLGGFALLGAFNAIAWGSMLSLSKKFRRPVSLLFPCVPGFAFLAWAHHNVDLSADPQAAIAIVLIPLLALLPIALGGFLGSFFDRFSARYR